MAYMVFRLTFRSLGAYTGLIMDKSVCQAADTVWEYMQLRQPVIDADCLLVLGSRDDRVARYASRLLPDYRFEHIVVSGGLALHNTVRKDRWGDKTEAAHFCDVLRRHGVDRDILLETEAVNTGQNATLSYRLLESRGIRASSVLIVTKPYMERRAKATFDVQWPDTEADIRVTSFGGTLQEYIDTVQTLESVLTVMVGDLDRIMKYPQLGYQSAQQVPQKVKHAFVTLVAAGYGQRLLNQG